MSMLGVVAGPGARWTAMVNVTDPALANWNVMGNACDGNSARVRLCSWMTGSSGV